MEDYSDAKSQIASQNRRLFFVEHILAGLIVFVLLFDTLFISYIYRYTEADNKNFTESAIRLRIHCDEANLIFNEIIGPGTKNSIDDVYLSLDKAKSNLEAMHNSVHKSSWFLINFDKQAYHKDISELKSTLDKLKLATQKEYEAFTASGFDPALYRQYSDTYNALIRKLNATESNLLMELDRKERNFHTAQTVMIVISLSLILVFMVQLVRKVSLRWHNEQTRNEFIWKQGMINQDLESVVYSSSHDLRSPLLNIQGFATLAASGCEKAAAISDNADVPAEIREKLSNLLLEDIPASLDYIIQSAGKMDTLIKGLLKLSRLGRESVQIQPQDMNKIVREIINTKQYHIDQTGATVTVENLPMCKTDSMQISQVFTNLLDNALKYLDPDRKGVIRISGKVQGSESVYIVEDNGIGISAEQQEKIFDIFHRVDSTCSVSGEGLGLTIVKHILDKQGGQICLESEPGKGSKFYVTLPTC